MSHNVSARTPLSAALAAALGAAAVAATPALTPPRMPVAMTALSDAVSLSSLDLPFPYPTELTGLLALIDANGTTGATKTATNFLDYITSATTGFSTADFVGNFPGAIYPNVSALESDLSRSGLKDVSAVLQTVVDGKLPTLGNTVSSVDHFVTHSIPGFQGVLLSAVANVLVDVSWAALTIADHVGDAVIAFPGADGSVRGFLTALETAASDLSEAIDAALNDFSTFQLPNMISAMTTDLVPAQKAINTIVSATTAVINGALAGIADVAASVGPALISQSLRTTMELVAVVIPQPVTDFLKKLVPPLPIAASAAKTAASVARPVAAATAAAPEASPATANDGDSMAAVTLTASPQVDSTDTGVTTDAPAPAGIAMPGVTHTDGVDVKTGTSRGGDRATGAVERAQKSGKIAAAAVRSGAGKRGARHGNNA